MRPARLDPEVLLLEQLQYPAIYAEGTFTSPSSTSIDDCVWQDRGTNDIQTAQNAICSSEVSYAINADRDELYKEKSALERAGLFIGDAAIRQLAAVDTFTEEAITEYRRILDQLNEAIEKSFDIVAFTLQDLDYVIDAIEITLGGTGLGVKDRKSMQNFLAAIKHHKSAKPPTV